MRKKITLVIVVLMLVGIGAWFIGHKNSSVKTGTDKSQSVKKTGDKSIPTPSFDKTKYPIDKPESIWVIASKVSPLNPINYTPSDLVSVGGGQQMRQEAATALKNMITDAAASGLNIKPLSGYRSYATQVSVYNKEVANYGQTVADRESARPGTSEHQTGLAIDVGGGGCGIEDCFGNTAEGKWLSGNAYKYGFIIRYIPGKETITGYRPEPWHIRYIGKELAAELNRTSTKTLEEFFNVVPDKQPY